MPKNKHIYFDHSATTPVDPDVLKTMMPYFSEIYGNPSSIHNYGQNAMIGVEKAKKQAADFLNCAPDEVIFTAGATESNNLALIGAVRALEKKQPGRKLHIITSVIEHDSILEPVAYLQKNGIEATHLPVDKRGVIKLEELRNAIKDETALVSLMYVNSEVGSMQPIKEAGKIIKKVNEERLKNWNNAKPAERGEKPQPIIFHTDATQAVNFLHCKVDELKLDMLSLSAHKIYGPKGVGLLYVKKGTPMIAQQLGGHHQGNRRSGTLNTPGIVGLGHALSKLSPNYQEKTNKKIAAVRDYLIKGIIKNIPDVVLNTDTSVSTPAHAHFSFLGVEGESLLIALDLEKIAVSTGSACASNSLKASHVIVAMGIKVEVAHSSIRFSLGKHNTKDDIDRLIKALPPIVKRLRDFNPLYKK
jgi:cysteine desulfurase